MPRFPVHQHPTHDYQCSDCGFWLLLTRKQMSLVQTPQGAAFVDTETLLKQGQDSATVATGGVAQCTRFPKWEPTLENHWCGEYASRPVKTNGG